MSRSSLDGIIGLANPGERAYRIADQFACDVDEEKEQRAEAENEEPGNASTRPYPKEPQSQTGQSEPDHRANPQQSPLLQLLTSNGNAQGPERKTFVRPTPALTRRGHDVTLSVSPESPRGRGRVQQHG